MTHRWLAISVCGKFQSQHPRTTSNYRCQGILVSMLVYMTSICTLSLFNLLLEELYLLPIWQKTISIGFVMELLLESMRFDIIITVVDLMSKTVYFVLTYTYTTCYNSKTLEQINKKNFILELTQENSIENSVQDCLPYILQTDSLCYTIISLP